MDDIVCGCVSQGMTKQGAATQLTYVSCVAALFSYPKIRKAGSEEPAPCGIIKYVKYEKIP